MVQTVNWAGWRWIMW